MKVLITGANGFTAKHLSKVLNKNSDLQQVFSDIVFSNATSGYLCDFTDFSSVLELIKKIRPDQIYHLIGGFTNDYADDYQSNVQTTKFILDSILLAKIKCRVLLVGSCAEYGNVLESDNPVTEECPLKPVSIYGLNKVFQTQLMRFYFSIHNMDIVMARTFNLCGKGISNKLFIGKVYEQIDAYKKKKISSILLGNLDNKRDYIDVMDAVEYYEMIMNHGVSGEIYNVGSGRPIRIRDLLQNILKENALSMDVIETRQTNNPNKLDIREIYADIRKLLDLKKQVSSNTVAKG